MLDLAMTVGFFAFFSWYAFNRSSRILAASASSSSSSEPNRSMSSSSSSSSSAVPLVSGFCETAAECDCYISRDIELHLTRADANFQRQSPGYFVSNRNKSQAPSFTWKCAVDINLRNKHKNRAASNELPQSEADGLQLMFLTTGCLRLNLMIFVYMLRIYLKAERSPRKRTWKSNFEFNCCPWKPIGLKSAITKSWWTEARWSLTVRWIIGQSVSETVFGSKWMGAAAQADVQLRIVRKFPSHPLRRWSNMLDAPRIKESCCNRSTQNEQIIGKT